MNIIKRNGSEVEFNSEKIRVAVAKANNATQESARISNAAIDYVTNEVTEYAENTLATLSVEDIQDKIENVLMKVGPEVARNFINYRYKRALVRKANTTDEQILALLERNNEEAKQENSNKNPIINSTQRDYMAGEVSKDLTMRMLLPEDVVKAHKEGIIHFHDADYFAQHMHNCCLVNLDDMLQNGTVIGSTLIEKPHSFSTACNIGMQAVAQVASSQYGGQTISAAHLAKFIDVSRQSIRKEILSENEDAGIEMTDQQIEKVLAKRLYKEIQKGVQTIQYQIITLMTTNGQAPFLSVYMDLNEAPEGSARDDLAMMIEEILRQRIQGVKNEKGVWITPAFPKLLYVLDDFNDHEGSKYWSLTNVAAQCTAKRMVPDYISAKIMREYKQGDVYGCMGCRSFLTPDNENNAEGLCNADNKANAKNFYEGEHKYYGRFNQGVVTLNLVDVACSSGKDMDKFWQLMEERSELVHKALRCRHERLLGTPSDVAPILWQNGALARLKKGETIDKLLYGNYSTISYGYAGLYECVYYMTGHSHTDPEAKDFALKIMQHMNDKCAEWRKAENIAYSVYGTPLESTTYRFAKALQKRFGIIPEVTDHDYITNSYHVNVREHIDSFKKLAFEAEFQRLSPGGAISYVEMADLTNNIEAVLAHIQFMSQNIMYAEMNMKSDYCECCGYDGEIKIVHDENDKLVWECPNCGNRDESKMNVARRTCGYIGSNFWNQGRTQEIEQRFVHISVPKLSKAV
ncbi:MAG: anaerobic ribonucleoside-triphosphate reductase [Butyrivibrio sp.]|uniref:anaerobic ribonucleoside-triphosphate reductase n=1 Tax=Butyrivibrio sp. TaxID=28121 RepID=UPI001B3D1EB4|nr:anaerobic ribonucleoside-triphosphate reductase [Butyrivibrio sp.]MBP3784507.1 anaerobic ribonucleoside-triphosphate reductase [Butyrivibrio sp.]